MTREAQRDVAEVKRVVEQVWEHFANQDPEAMLGLLHETCTVWDVFQPQLVDKASIASYVAADFAQSAARGKLSRAMRDFVIHIWDDTALVRFYSSYRYEPPHAISGNGRTTVVLRRFPEGWRFVHVHEGHIPGGIPPLTETP